MGKIMESKQKIESDDKINGEKELIRGSYERRENDQGY